MLWEINDGLRRVAELVGSRFGLSGFISLDLFCQADTDDPVIIEANPRPVAQLLLGRRVGVDMSRALRDVMSGDFDGQPRLSRDGGPVPLFPNELERLRARHGNVGGTLRWLKRPGTFADVPWNDPGLLRHILRGLR